MIPRYSRDIVTNIWSQESKYKIWLDIEIYAAEAMEKYKIIPRRAKRTSLWKKK